MPVGRLRNDSAALGGVVNGYAPLNSGLLIPTAYIAATYGRVVRTADYTTTSTTFADLHASDFSITITTGAKPCLVSASIGNENSALGVIGFLDFTIDGTRYSGEPNGIAMGEPEYSSGARIIQFSVITDALSAGSHTFVLQARVNSGTGHFVAGFTGNGPGQFSVLAL